MILSSNKETLLISFYRDSEGVKVKNGLHVARAGRVHAIVFPESCCQAQ